MQPDLPRFGALSSLPPDYRLVRRLTIESRRTVMLLNLYSLAPLLVGAIFFMIGMDQLLNSLHVRPLLDVPMTDETRVPLAVLTVILTILLLSIHELCHGLAFQLFGVRPRYGINLSKGVAYASASDHYLTRDAYLVVALAPLVMISLGAVILMALTGGSLRFVMALLGTLNAGSSVGDLWFVAVCVRYPRSLLVRDYGDGAELFTRQSGS
jgi:Putative zincin peptidase